MGTPHLRPAKPGEEEALSRLCLKSKAYWGYDAAFMAAVAPHLKVTGTAIAQGLVTVAEADDGTVLGVSQLDPEGRSGSLELLFIAPEAIGSGLGRALFDHAAQQLRALGHTVMTILSDPYSEPAYIHMGARRVEMRPSRVFKDRELPWMEVDL